MIAEGVFGPFMAALCLLGLGVLVALVVRAAKGRTLFPGGTQFGPVDPAVLLGTALLCFVGMFVCQWLTLRAGLPGAAAGALLAAAIAAAVHRLLLRAVHRPRGAALPRYGKALLVTWAALPVVYGVALLVQALGGSLPQTTVTRIGNRADGWAGLALMAVTVAPLLEELIFRGLLYPVLRSRWGPRAALVATALLFGVIHEPAVWAAMAIYGGFLAYLVEATGSYWPGVASHAAFNGLTVVQLIAA